MAISAEVRAELARRARDKRRRQSVFTSQAPCKWHPYQVSMPESGLPFDDASAWNFIADLLDAGHDVAEIVMDKPQGQIGYVLLVDGHPGCPEIYIKLTLSSNMVNGRSFHDSECNQ
jgi:hypothetical protein